MCIWVIVLEDAESKMLNLNKGVNVGHPHTHINTKQLIIKGKNIQKVEKTYSDLANSYANNLGVTVPVNCKGVKTWG